MPLVILLGALGLLGFVAVAKARAAEPAPAGTPTTDKPTTTADVAAAAIRETRTAETVRSERLALQAAEAERTAAALGVVEAGLAIVGQLVDIRQSNLADAEKLHIYLDNMTREQRARYNRLLDQATMADSPIFGRAEQWWWKLSTRVARDAYRARLAERVLGIA